MKVSHDLDRGLGMAVGSRRKGFTELFDGIPSIKRHTQRLRGHGVAGFTRRLPPGIRLRVYG